MHSALHCCADFLPVPAKSRVQPPTLLRLSSLLYEETACCSGFSGQVRAELKRMQGSEVWNRDGLSHWAGNWLPLRTPILLSTHPSHISFFCFALFILICVQTTNLVHFPTVILFFWLVSFWFCVLKLPFPFLTQSCSRFTEPKINGSPGEENFVYHC